MKKMAIFVSAIMTMAVMLFGVGGSAQKVFASTVLPRITTCSGSPAYFCTTSGTVFKPAGVNYTQTMNATYPYYNQDTGAIDTATGLIHATLLTNYYNASQVQSDLSQIKNDGYNYIRVLIPSVGYVYTTDSTGNVTGQYYGIAGPRTDLSNDWNGLYIPYMQNVISLLQTANSLGLYVYLELDWYPDNSYYEVPTSAIPADSQGPIVSGVNDNWMVQADINSKAAYVKNFMTYVKNADPNLLSTIIALDLQNEIYVMTTDAPFNRTSGTVTLPDGQTYDMSNAASRQQAVDASFGNWSSALMSALHSVDPSAMGTASVFTFHAVGLSGPNGVYSGSDPDKRYPARPLMLAAASPLSFIDMHVYPGANFTIQTDLASSEFSSIDTSQKPLWLGEFGAFTSVYPTITDAAYGLQDFKNEAEQLGFKAWGVWDWNDATETNIYYVTEDNGAINGALAPVLNGW